MIRIFFASEGGPTVPTSPPDLVVRDQAELSLLIERGRTKDRVLEPEELRIMEALVPRLESRTGGDVDVVASAAVFKIFDR